MGRLLHPGIGELADRLTILELKVRHAPLDSDLSHFHAELAQVQLHLDRHKLEGFSGWQQKLRELRETNARLWALEDQMAAVARPAVVVLDQRRAQEIAELGMSIWRANQLRNVLIGEINARAGTVRGPEKL